MSIAKSDHDPGHDETLTEKVEHAVRGDDEPIEEVHPHGTAALVSMTYPILLIAMLVVAVILVTIFW